MPYNLQEIPIYLVKSYYSPYEYYRLNDQKHDLYMYDENNKPYLAAENIEDFTPNNSTIVYRSNVSKYSYGIYVNLDLVSENIKLENLEGNVIEITDVISNAFHLGLYLTQPRIMHEMKFTIQYKVIYKSHFINLTSTNYPIQFSWDIPFNDYHIRIDGKYYTFRLKNGYFALSYSEDNK